MSEWLKPEILMQVIALVFAAFAAYFAIKSDLKVMHTRMDALKDRHDVTDKRIERVEGDVKVLLYGDRRHIAEGLDNGH